MAMTCRCALLSLFLAAVFPFAAPSSHCDVDMTLQSGAIGENVVLTTVKKIEDSGIFPENFGFLRRMAAVETGDGEMFINGTGGIWRIDTQSFSFVNGVIRTDLYKDDFETKFEENFCFEWSNTITEYGDLDIPLYSALAVMVRLSTAGRSILSEDIDEQAQVWKSIFRVNGDVKQFIETVTKLEECEIVGVEMVFVMDESGSVGSDNYEMMRQFAIDITDSFEIGPERTRVAWISFATGARVIFNLDSYTDKATLHTAIQDAPYSRGSTNTGAGLSLLNGIFSPRQTFDVPKVAIVVTDGQSNRGDLNGAVAALRKDINIFVIGVTDNINIDELELIASAGVTTDNFDHVYTITGFIEEELETLQKTIRARACFDAMFTGHETSVEMLTGARIPIPMATLHFNLDCPPEGLTINACGREGETILYISLRPNPDSAHYDMMLVLTEDRCLNTFIDCSIGGNGRRRRQTPGTEPEDRIYITIEGVREENVYNLDAEEGDHSTPQVNLQCVKDVSDDQESFVVRCTSDRDLTDIQCSINHSPTTSCTLPQTVAITPPIRDYRLQINVTDSLNLTDTFTIYHQVSPLSLACSLNMELKVECLSNHQLDETVCTFNGVTADPCILPYEIDVKGLPVGAHTVNVTVTDVFGQTAVTTLDYIVVEDRVGDDMVFSTVVDLRPIELNVFEPTVSLCYQVHGQEGHFYNLISDYCVSVNAHVSQPKTEIDSHVMDAIGIRAIGSNGTCYNIAIIRENCAVSINNQSLEINSKFEEESVIVHNDRTIARNPNVIHVSVQNCGRPLVNTMHITCTEYHIRHSAIPTEVLEFTTIRGLSPIDAAHGLLGQFWGRFMLGRPLSPVQGQNDKEMTIFHQSLLKRFSGFVHGSWSSRGEMCFYAGDRQGGPVILGQYEDYEVETLLSTEYIFSKFEGETFDP